MTKPGYKMTEVGMIPEDWEVKELGEVGSMKSGNGITGDYIFTEGIYPCYGGNGLRGFTHKFTHDGIFPLIGRQGAHCGNVKLVTGKFFASEHAVVFNPASGTSPHFAYFFLKRLKLNRLSESSAQPGLSVNKLKKLPIPLPPTLKEQRLIAGALSEVDALIAQHDKLIAKKQAIKQGAMQQLLTGQTRLPGFGQGKGYKMTEVGRIPEDWEVSKFDEIGEAIIGLTYSPTEVSNNGYLVHRSSNIQENQLSYLDNVFVEKEIPQKLILQKHDILICVRNGSKNLIGKAALIVGESVGETFGAFMSVFRTILDPKFIFQVIISEIIQRQISTSLGATINQITNKTLYSFQIPLPPTLKEQRLIAQTLSDLDSSIQELQRKKSKLQSLKQGMMQELLTGKTRLI
ncbi:MAG: restriction endonuclease subunit S [Bacteroidota bacterium]